MSYVIFNNLVDMTTVATPSNGYTVAYDLDGIIKQKDQFGVVTPIAGSGGIGSTPSLSSVLSVGNTTGTNDLIVASGTGIVSDYGTSKVFFSLATESHIYLSSDNGTNQESLIDLNSKNINLKSTGLDREINIGVSYNFNSDKYQEISIKENAFFSRSVNSNDRSAVFIGTKDSSFNAGVSNSVIIGGTTLTATQSNTVYLGNTVNINGQYRLPSSDGSSNQILKTDGLGNVTWQNENSSPNLATVLAVGATTGANDIIIQSGQFIKSTSGNSKIDLGIVANQLVLENGIGESISLGEKLVQIFATPSSTTQSSVSIGINNDDILVSTNLISSTSSNTDKNPIFVGSRNSSFNSGITNSVIIGGSNISATQSNTLYTSNIQLQGDVLGKYTVQPSTQPGWDSLSIPTKGYVDSVFATNVTGTGTVNFLPKWTGSTSLSSTSSFFDDGTASTSTNMSINGVYAGRGSSNISTNTVFGFEAINSSTSSGINNTAIGRNSMRSNGSGGNNTAVGLSSLQLNNTGYQNVAIGVLSLRTNSTGNDNVAIGYYSQYSNTTGFENVSIGSDSLRTNTTGTNTVAIGNQSLYFSSTGLSNVAVGYKSSYNSTTGSFNVSIGYQSLFDNRTGTSNVSVGLQNSYSLRGGNNVSVGTRGLYSSATSSNNSTIGHEVLFGNTIGSNNTAIGAYAGYESIIGNNNTFLGYNTGRGLTSGSNNTFVGSNITVSAGTTGSIFISNGSGNIRIVADSSGKIGINNLVPNTRLDVSGDLATRHSSIQNLTGTYNNYSTSDTSYIVVENSSGSPVYITGFSDGYIGKRLTITNTGPDDIIIQHNNSSSLSSNRIITGNAGTDLVVSDDESIELVYETIENRWRVNSSIFQTTTGFTGTFDNGISQISTNVYGIGGSFLQNTSIDAVSFDFTITNASTITLSASSINLGQSVVINNSYTLPNNSGVNGYLLTTDGSGLSSWTSSTSLGLTKKHKDLRTFTASVTESITHNLGTEDVFVQTFDSTGQMIIPGNIQITGTGSVDIIFSSTLTNVKTIIIG